MGGLDLKKRNSEQKFEKVKEKYHKFTTAENFVDDLLSNGVNIYCDESTNAFNNQIDLPYFYNGDLFKKGQSFFFKHIFALFMCKFFGLISLLAVPSILRILVYTKMSSTNLTSYRRYMSTIFHMVIWYEEDFKPGSRLWQSLGEIKNRHNSASKRSCSAGIGRISQKDMALTQFGFMGIALVKGAKVGIHNATTEEWKSFIHVWRVIGYLLGIEDRFNICRESIDETKEICKQLLNRVFLPGLEKKEREFMEMTSYLVNGMWSFNPSLKYNVFLNYMYITLQNDDNNDNNNLAKAKNKSYLKSNYLDIFFLFVIINTVYSLKFTIFRLYHNYVQIFSLWLMKVFPFLAYYQFGRENSHVIVLPK